MTGFSSAGKLNNFTDRFRSAAQTELENTPTTFSFCIFALKKVRCPVHNPLKLAVWYLAGLHPSVGWSCLQIFCASMQNQKHYGNVSGFASSNAGQCEVVQFNSGPGYRLNWVGYGPFQNEQSIMITSIPKKSKGSILKPQLNLWTKLEDLHAACIFINDPRLCMH